MASGQSFGRRAAAGPRAPRLGQQGAARAGRGRPQERTAASAVVATSSLELGIDMGAVDLVIQVEAPPSVASGLQRIGRAGHQVGEISQGVLFPKHRTDLIGCAVTVQRMLAGEIETMRVPTNPLDVLAQHTVAACALEPLDADRWFDAVRRSAPFATLPRSAFEATLDLLSGKYPSTEFAELRPRLVYDRDAGTLTARPGRAAAGGDLRRRDPGPRPVHRLPGHRLRKAFAGRRTRRGDGLRVPARRRHLAGRHQLADHRDHPRPGAGHPGAGPAGAAAVLARRRRGQARPNWVRRVGAFTGELARLGREEFDAALPRDGFRRVRDRQPVAAARRPATGHRHGADRHHVRGRTVPRRAGRLAGDPALPLRASGARTACAGGVAAAAGALRHRREADRLRRRHHRAAAGHRRRSARCRPVRVRRRRDRTDRHRRGGRLGAVRLAVPRMRRPRTAFAAPASGQALAAVASAAARCTAPRRRPQVPRLPDRAGGGPRMPAGRL